MRAGDDDLRAAGLAAHVHQIDLDALALDERFALDLLAGGQDGVGRLRARADAQGDAAVARVDAGDDAGEDLMLLGVVLLIDHAALGLAQALDDDLLAVAGGDAAELDVIDRKIDDAAHLVLGGELLRVLERHLRAGVLDLFDNLLLHIHLQIALCLVHVHDHVLHALVVALVGGGECLHDLIHHKGLGNAALLFEHCKGGKDFIAFHGNKLLIIYDKVVVVRSRNGDARARSPAFQSAAFRCRRSGSQRRCHSPRAHRKTPCARRAACRS